MHLLEKFDLSHEVNIYTEQFIEGDSGKILHYEKLLEERVNPNDIFIVTWRELPVDGTIKSSVLNFLSNNIHGSNILFYFSSVAVYGCNKYVNRETDPLRPINDYGRAKIEFENYLLNNFESRLYILRISNVFGRKEFDDLINRILTACFKNVPLKLTEPERVLRDFVSVDTIFSVVSQLIIGTQSYNSYKVINLGSGKSMLLLEILQFIENTLNVKIDFEILPLSDDIIKQSKISTSELMMATNLKTTEQMPFLADYIKAMKNQIDSQF